MDIIMKKFFNLNFDNSREQKYIFSFTSKNDIKTSLKKTNIGLLKWRLPILKQDQLNYYTIFLM